MDEIALSNDLDQIEFEINYHKQVAGQSVWEIGRRLNHVKENDLAHGEFINWYESIGLDRHFTQKSMKIAKEIPKSQTFGNLGETALYLISTLPAEDQQEELKKAEQGDPSTVRELQEIKRKNKELEKQAEQARNSEQIAIQQLEEEQNKEPEVIEKEVVKEVKPDDYDELKSHNQQLNSKIQELEQQNKEVRERHNKMLSERKETNEKSAKYEELTKAIENSDKELNETQKLISNYKRLMKLLKETNEAILKASGLVYSDLSEVINRDSLASREFKSVMNNLERLEKDLTDLITKPQILEGEIIND